MELSSFLIISIFLTLLFSLFHYLNRTLVVPINWPVLGMTPGLLANVHRLHDYVLGYLCASNGTFHIHGPWFINYDYLVTCDPANAAHIFGSRFNDYPKGKTLREIFMDSFGLGIFNVDGELWSKQRRMAHAFLSGSRFQSYAAKFICDKLVDTVLPLLQREADMETAFDLNSLFKKLSVDLTNKLVLGVDTKCVNGIGNNVSASYAVMEEVVLLRHVVPVWKLMRYLGIGFEKRMSDALDNINKFNHRIIQEKRNNTASDHCDDMLSYYLNNPIDVDEGDESNGYYRSDSFLHDTLKTFLAAGKDTTAAALIWLFYLLSKNPAVADKIVTELVRLGKPTAGVYEEEVLEHAIFLHAAILESLRLYPPVPFNHKTATKATVLPSGHRVGEGTAVLFFNYATGRMESVWGKDCMEFKPERWIDEKGTRLIPVSSSKFVAFQSGPRACAGKGLAMTVIKMVAATMVYGFRFEGVEGCQVEKAVAIVLLMKNGFMTRVKKREHH